MTKLLAPTVLSTLVLSCVLVGSATAGPVAAPFQKQVASGGMTESAKALPPSAVARFRAIKPGLDIQSAQYFGSQSSYSFWRIDSLDRAFTCIVIDSAERQASSCLDHSEFEKGGLPLSMMAGHESFEVILLSDSHGRSPRISLSNKKAKYYLLGKDLLVVSGRLDSPSETLKINDRPARIVPIPSYRANANRGTVALAGNQPSSPRNVEDPYFSSKTPLGVWHYAPIRKSIIGADAYTTGGHGSVWIEADKGNSAVGYASVRMTFPVMTSGSRCKLENAIPNIGLICNTDHW